MKHAASWNGLTKLAIQNENNEPRADSVLLENVPDDDGLFPV